MLRTHPARLPRSGCHVFAVQTAARYGVIVLLLTATGLPAASKCRAADDPEAALVKLGALVTRDTEDPRHPIVAVDFHGLQVMDQHLALLQGLSTLKRLDLHDCRITASPASIAQLSTLTSLEELTFANSLEGSDAWLEPVRSLTNLKVLNADIPAVRFFPVIHDQGIANLQPLVNLQRLRISNTEIKDKSMTYLESMGDLREFELIWTSVTNRGIAVLKKFPHLRKLTVSSPSIDNQGLKVLADLSELEELTLSGNMTGEVLKNLHAPQMREIELIGPSFGDEAVRNLQKMPKLEAVRLTNASVTDHGIAGLNKLKQLRTLELTSCDATGPGLKALRDLKQLRTLRITGSNANRPPKKPQLDPHTLDCLKQFPNLEVLNFSFAYTGNDSLEPLKHATKLKKLWLNRDGIDDQGMKHLEGLAELESLNLTFNDVWAGGLASLQKLPKLETLDIANFVTDEGVQQISGCTSLKHLNLDGSKTTDVGASSLGKLTNLEFLSLVNCDGISDAGCESLANLTKLQVLLLGSERIGDPTAAQIANLKELTELRLIGTKVDKPGLERLAELPKLRSLWITSPDWNTLRQLQERNQQVLVRSNGEKMFLRGVRWNR